MTSVFGNVGVNVVPRVYGASELGVLSITAPGEAHPRVEYVGGELFVGLDAADDAAPVTRGQAESWATPFSEALAAAVSSTPALPEPVDGVITVADEAAAASVLVSPSRLTAPADAGAPVVFALTRTHLLVVGAADETAMARVLDTAEALYESGEPLVSAHPLTVADGAWAAFPWRERMPALSVRFERMLRLFSVRAYEAQTAALQRPDVRYIDPKIRVLETGVTTTFATWPKGVASLLPVVDNVVVADPSGAISVATMAQFLEAGGDAIVRTGLSPARYFVPGDQPQG